MNPTKTFSISTAADKHWKIKDIVEGQGQLDNDAARGDDDKEDDLDTVKADHSSQSAII